MSDRKATANKENARKSTGPLTTSGKAASSQNALQHGLLSRRLLLPSENPAEFQALLQQLQFELVPVGMLEFAMVERIAIAYWRQRRLVSAEAAMVEVQQSDFSYTSLCHVRSIAQLNNSDDSWIKVVAADTPDLAEIETAIQELLHCESNISISTFRKKCPQAWLDLCMEFDPQEGSSVAQLESDAHEYFVETHSALSTWMVSTLDQYRKLSRLIYAISLVRQAQAIPSNAENMARYQSALDNDVYKATRALREAQKHRFEQAAINANAVEH